MGTQRCEVRAGILGSLQEVYRVLRREGRFFLCDLLSALAYDTDCVFDVCLDAVNEISAIRKTPGFGKGDGFWRS